MRNLILNDLIMKLVKDFNEYSELVALGYAKQKEGKCDEEMLQWNRGSLNKIEDYLKQLADVVGGMTLKWECEEHTFGFDDWKRPLEYRTVQAVVNDKKKEVTLNCDLVASGQYYLNETRLHFDEPWAVYVVNGDMYMPYYRIYINDKFVGIARYQSEACKFLLKAETALITRV